MVRRSGGFDQQVIEATFLGQFSDLFEQVFTQGAADAAVAHLHQFFFGAVEADVALHLAAVDVDFAHVVDDDRDAQVVAVAQYIVEQRALPAPRKPDNTVTGRRLGIRSFSSGCPVKPGFAML
jgi:hypothetical protein